MISHVDRTNRASQFHMNVLSVASEVNSNQPMRKIWRNSNFAGVDGHRTCWYQKDHQKAPVSMCLSWFRTMQTITSIKIQICMSQTPTNSTQQNLYFEFSYFSQNLFSGAPCNDSYSFCGLRDQKYPDKRAMGYPFDRNSQLTADQNVASLSEFTEGLSNAYLGEVTIRFTNTVVSRSR